MISQEHEEILQTLETVNEQLQDLVVRGLRSADSGTIASLRSVHEEFARIGAVHLAENLQKLVQGIEDNSPQVAKDFLRTQTSLRLFERILTLQSVEATIQNIPFESEE